MKLLLILLAGLFSTNTFAALSVYTSAEVKDCITLDSDEFDAEPEIDYHDSLCQGQGPYVLKVSGGDIRYSVSVLFRGQEIGDLTKTDSFHNPGAKVVEWRYEEGQKWPNALIFRINASHGGDLGSVDLLHVAKLDGMSTCTVAVIPSQAKMNEKAREIADNIDDHNCL